MSLKVGIIGLPNAGKSTLFNALVKKQLAKVADYPFTTIKPCEGTVDVADKRLDMLSQIVRAQKTTPSQVTFVDIAGLVKGAHKGEGLGNEFLGYIRNVTAILQVVRAFEDENARHPLSTIDPQRDIDIVNTELILKDLEIGSKALEKEKTQQMKQLIKKANKWLNEGKLLSDYKFLDKEIQTINQYQFLTNKPFFYVLNISENVIGSKKIERIGNADMLVICAKLEADLLELTQREQKEYLEAVGVEKSSLDTVISKAYLLLDLISFYTIKGGREVRAWAIKRGKTAIDAAYKVHSDMAKGFINAEVIEAENLIKIGGWDKAHDMGKIKTEGRDYQVSDGDVLEFKFKK